MSYGGNYEARMNWHHWTRGLRGGWGAGVTEFVEACQEHDWGLLDYDKEMILTHIHAIQDHLEAEHEKRWKANEAEGSV